MRKYFDFKILRFIGLIYAFFSLITFCKNSYLKINGHKFEEMNWHTLIVKVHIYDWILVMIYITVIIIFVRHFNKSETNKFIVLLFHLAGSIFLGYYMFFFSSVIEVILDNASFNEYSYAINQVRIISVIDLNFLIYLSLITILYVYYYFKKLKALIIQKNLVEQKLSVAELQELKSRLHPKFLFSELKKIKSTIDKNPLKSEQLIVEISELLRSMIDETNENFVPINQEIEFTRKYLKIKNQNSNVFLVDFNVAKNLEYSLIPSILFLPIFESLSETLSNKVSNPISIKIEARKKKNRIQLQLTIKNYSKENLTLMSKSTLLGDLFIRLQKLYKEKFKKNVSVSKKDSIISFTFVNHLAEFKLVR